MFKDNKGIRIENENIVPKHLQNEEKVNSNFLTLMIRFVINFEEYKRFSKFQTSGSDIHKFLSDIKKIIAMNYYKV